MMSKTSLAFFNEPVLRGWCGFWIAPQPHRLGGPQARITRVVSTGDFSWPHAGTFTWPRDTQAHPRRGPGLDAGEDDVIVAARGIGERGGAAAGRRSACRSTTRSRLICAGWLPQDRVFGSELSAWSRNERRRSSTLSAAHSLGGVLLLALRPYVRR